MSTTICSFDPDPSDFTDTSYFWYRCPHCESVTQLTGNALLRCGECGAIESNTITCDFHPMISDSSEEGTEEYVIKEDQIRKTGEAKMEQRLLQSIMSKSSPFSLQATEGQNKSSEDVKASD